MKKRVFLILFLISFIIFSAVTFVSRGTNYLANDYFSSEDFQMELNDYYRGLMNYMLDQVDVEAVKKNMTVSQEEVEYYREYYGSLSDQIASIQQQYTNQMNASDAVMDEEVLAALKAERDQKIADVKANFENDDIVREKIKAIKVREIEKYAKQQQQNRKFYASQYPYFGYELKNMETGETFTSFKEGKFLYEMRYDENTPLDGSLYSDSSEVYEEAGVQFSLRDAAFNWQQSESDLDRNTSSYVGVIYITDQSMQGTGLKISYDVFQQEQLMYFSIWIAGGVFLLLFFLPAVWRPLWEESKVESFYNRLPFDVRVIIWGIFVFVTIAYVGAYVGSAFSMPRYAGEIIETIILLGMYVFCLSWSILLTVWLVKRVKYGEQLKQDWKNSVFSQFWIAIRDLFLNWSLAAQTIWLFVVFFFAGIGLAGSFVAPELFLIYIPLFIFVLLPTLYVFIQRMGYLTKIMQQVDQMAAGQFTGEVEIVGKSPIAKHAANVNALKEGVRKSLSEQAKSERLKTELITNVSHDLRTPLTSIITYTDLLKNPSLTQQEREKYIDILDKKSARLKTLIEDLFDVSKMASGNVQLDKSQVDLAQMLYQLIGEHEEQFEKSLLDLRVTIGEQPILAQVDAQKWWRVLDNLLVNAQKYSLEGTRVYISLQIIDNQTVFSIKNVAKYELSENVEELVERFKRADASRHTEGSGLGLAIAQSIVDLHEGMMDITIDGDLFKVTVKI